ncbi:MAG: type II secretion system minor pseudopilin GspJ [Magnetococcales bacterium]|nr:type II secretion system minor pseudopilin GspJ [Magnetococcales bacterium]MBF0321762.1 type II secretion system minor pseudopilin GspJ [Magnetococcales bacterium]
MVNPEREEKQRLHAPGEAYGRSGFTLVELLIALAVLGIMFVMAFGGLKALLGAQESVSQRNRDLSRLQMFVNQIRTDLEQAIDRSIRDSEGVERPSMEGLGEGETFLVFTRTGRDNPRQVRRSAMQRVAYSFEKNQLIRLSWELLDQAPDTAPTREVLLDDLLGVDVRYLDNDLAWHTHWPASTHTLGSNLPRAVDIVLEIRNWGRLRQLVKVRD